MGSVDPTVLTALYIAGDDRHYPDHARREDGAVRAVLRPLHRVPVTRGASVDDVKPDEFAALIHACEHWRDRFLLGVMYFGGLRHGEALGLRLSDLHFAESSAELGCRFPGPHLHVVPRANPNGARVKNERRRTVPVDTRLVGAFDHYLRRERDLCPAAAACDFVFVNLWHEPLGAPMKVSRVHKLFRSLSRRPASTGWCIRTCCATARAPRGPRRRVSTPPRCCSVTPPRRRRRSTSIPPRSASAAPCVRCPDASTVPAAGGASS